MTEQTKFVPRMQSSARGYQVIGDLKWRSWGGAVADIWQVKCDPGAHGSYVSPDPRLFIVLDITKGGRLDLHGPAAAGTHTVPFSMAYIPARVPVESRVAGVTDLRHLDIHLSEASLVRKFGAALDRARLLEPRLAFEDPRIGELAHLLAHECQSETPLNDLYGSGLIDALVTALFSVTPGTRLPRPGLSRAQLDISRDYIEAHCFETIRLHDLASLLGLSESWFSHAFKASTGMPPLRWQMEARIARVKDLLARDKASLTEIAALAGFADQAHLTRSFKRVVGVAPSDWRRSLAPK